MGKNLISVSSVPLWSNPSATSAPLPCFSLLRIRVQTAVAAAGARKSAFVRVRVNYQGKVDESVLQFLRLSAPLKTAKAYGTSGRT